MEELFMTEKIMNDLRPLIVEADRQRNFTGPCPACEQSRWKTRAEGFLCRTCGYLRVPE